MPTRLFLFRLLAFIVDSIIILILAELVYFIGIPFFHSHTTDIFGVKINMYLTRFGPIVSWLYHSIFECSNIQATPGKYFLKLKVSDIMNQKANFAQTTLRHFSKIVSLILLGSGYIMIFFNKNHQCLHDYISSTIITLRKVE